jgi:hypothetical protein
MSDQKALIQQLKARLNDQFWRLNNLYVVQDAQGKVVLFKMNDAQLKLHSSLHYFNIILKARQLGISTYILMLFLDSALFDNNKSFGVIAHTKVDASELLGKIKFAYDNLHPFIKNNVQMIVNSATKVAFSNGCVIRVGVSLRSGTYQRLHISEFGKVAAHNPLKSKEIVSGAMNTVHAGCQLFVESTAEGQSGDFYNLVDWARKLKDEGRGLTAIEPKLHFYPWFDNKSYTLPEATNLISISKEFQDYFQKVPATLTAGQKVWYVQKHKLLNELMMREYPSTIDEAFQASLEGAYFTKQMQLLRKNNRITKVPYAPNHPVFTFWDLNRGGSDDMAILFMQYINNEYRFINYCEARNEPWSYFCNLLNSFGYGYAEHYWPHDGAHSVMGDYEVSTHKKQAQNFGINPIKIVSRSNHVHMDIMNYCKPALSNAYFDEVNCAKIITHLDNYKRKWSDSRGVWEDIPCHDNSSHGADSFRTFAMGFYKVAERQGIHGMVDSRGIANIHNNLYNTNTKASVDYNMFG